MLDHDKLEKNIKFPIYEIFSVFFFIPYQLSMTINAATTTRMYQIVDVIVGKVDTTFKIS